MRATGAADLEGGGSRRSAYVDGRPCHTSSYCRPDMSYSAGVRQGLLSMFGNMSRPDIAINPGAERLRTISYITFSTWIRWAQITIHLFVGTVLRRRRLHAAGVVSIGGASLYSHTP